MHPLALFYDLQILILLAASGAGCFILWRDRRSVPTSWAARDPRSRYALALCGLVAAALVYGSYIEPHLVVTRNVPITLSGARSLERPVRIAVVSDFHVGPYKGKRFVRNAVRRILDTEPDAVLIAGDFVYSDDGTEEWPKLAPLAELAKKVPVLAVLGNHDTGLGDEYHFIPLPDKERAVTDELTSLGVRVLKNGSELLTRNGTTIAVAGLAEYLTGESNHLDALRGIPPDVPRVMLAHNPGIIRFLDPQTVDLVITGHTHGGQIRIPFLPPLVRLPTPLGQHYDAGLFTFNTIPLFITRGIGESGPRARLFNLPEIAILTIQ